MRENWPSISRQVTKYHISIAITQDIEQLETWGLHCCVQKVIPNLMNMKETIWGPWIINGIEVKVPS